MIGSSGVPKKARSVQCLFQARISRSITSTAGASSKSHDSVTVSHPKDSARLPAISPKWLSDTKLRIGKCLTFGANAEQVKQAAAICKVLGQDWRELLAGSEGFLTDEKRAGLLGHKVVWGELDSMSHVNNVTYIRYAESARVNWAYNFAMHIDPEHKREWSDLWTPRGDGMILKSIKTDYKFPMTWPDQVSVFHKLREMPKPGASSFILDVMILSEREQRPSARCLEDIVIYDYRMGKKIPLRPFMLEAFEKLYRQQLETKERNSRRVLGLLEDVRQLEKGTWDRTDAKEDLGGNIKLLDIMTSSYLYLPMEASALSAVCNKSHQ